VENRNGPRRKGQYEGEIERRGGIRERGRGEGLAAGSSSLWTRQGNDTERRLRSGARRRGKETRRDEGLENEKGNERDQKKKGGEKIEEHSTFYDSLR